MRCSRSGSQRAAERQRPLSSRDRPSFAAVATAGMCQNPTHAPQQTMHTRSALQLALEFVPVAPIRSIGKDFVRIRLNQASFA
jgi:hypothetical protein